MLLDVPFASLVLRADGSGETVFATVGKGQTTADALVRRMVVAMAGVVGEANGEDERAWLPASQFVVDREGFAALESMFARLYPGLAHRSPLQIARVVLLSHEGRRAVDLVGRVVEASGDVPAATVASFVQMAYRKSGVEFPDPALVRFCTPWAVEPAAAADVIVDLVRVD